MISQQILTDTSIFPDLGELCVAILLPDTIKMTETSPITTNALYLAYPVCLGVTYLISSIAIKIQSSLGKVKSRRDSGVRYASSILWLLLLKCTLLVWRKDLQG